MRRLDGAATSDFTDTHAVRNVSFWHGPIVQARRRTCYGEQLRRTCYGEQLRCGLPFRDVQDFGLFVITYFNNIVCTFRKWFRRIGMRPRGWRIGLLHSSCACHTQPSQALQFMSACCTPLAHVTHSPARHCSSWKRVYCFCQKLCGENDRRDAVRAIVSEPWHLTFRRLTSTIVDVPHR